MENLLDNLTKCLVCLEVSRYLLELSDRLLSSFDFLPVFLIDKNFTPIYRYLKISLPYIGSGKFVRDFSQISPLSRSK
ncbi:hypothetical protein [Okeania sp. SIO2B3]|uniref:hypothetical protein n=1 Tax=Okeania sp. SIO2B3 TaxID=2607784 RepID=UPI0013BEDDC3|nr:hypothetical protein [Okeania sp. SIO2B3]NET41127.1 hypothetical protein [Okeania sp. SIO2B3]